MPEISGMIQQFLEGNIKTLSAEPIIESKTITENGTYMAPEGVDGYSPVQVNVEPVIESKTITENGTYTPESGVDGFAPVVVNVQSTAPVLKTKTITDNGTYNASDDNADGYSQISVNVPLPQNAYLLKSVSNLPQPIASFSDGAVAPMMGLKVAIEPQQDLHGYDAPWAGGAGKNKLPMTVEGIKAVNTYHSWSGNSTTINNVTITIETDENNNVTGIKFNGTASADITFNLASNISISNGSYVWSNNQTVNISNLWLSLTNPNVAITLNAKKEKNITIDNGSIDSAYIYASSGNVFNNIVFKPMIRLASVQDATFAPYSNICPISGWDEVEVTVADDTTDPTVENVYTIDLDGTRYGGEVDVVNGIVTPAPYYASYNGEALTGEWISDRDKYEVGTTPTIGAQVVNIGASGTPVSILPTAVKSLRGVNNVYANTGDIKDAEYFSKEV